MPPSTLLLCRQEERHTVRHYHRRHPEGRLAAQAPDLDTSCGGAAGGQSVRWVVGAWRWGAAHTQPACLRCLPHGPTHACASVPPPAPVVCEGPSQPASGKRGFRQARLTCTHLLLLLLLCPLPAAVVGDPAAWAWLVSQLDAVKAAARCGFASLCQRCLQHCVGRNSQPRFWLRGGAAVAVRAAWLLLRPVYLSIAAACVTCSVICMPSRQGSRRPCGHCRCPEAGSACCGGA
jgi:hypothetical protein